MSEHSHDRSTLKIQHPISSRKIHTVPFGEIHGGRVAGVVSSGSSSDRVYVSFIDAGTTNYYCSTKNNRPCGRLRGGPCKHIDAMMSEAVAQFGAPKVARALEIDADTNAMKSAYDITRHVTGTKTKEEASVVFSRFLAYLSFGNRPATGTPIPENSWFHVG